MVEKIEVIKVIFCILCFFAGIGASLTSSFLYLWLRGKL